MRLFSGVMACVCVAATVNAQDAPVNPYVQLMEKAAGHARENGANKPVLSPVDATVLSGAVPVKQLQAMGIKVVPWTTNETEKIRAVIRTGVDGLISDRPDLLQQVLKEELAAATTDAEKQRLAYFDVTAHRGGRGLRPENTLPSFESGLDQLVTTLETDTGVTTDGVSLIWHDQFLSPESCRKADGSDYTLANRVFTKDISSEFAQKTFICDKLHFGDAQKNDLSLSPVAVAFAKKEGLMSPYVPTYAAQLFRFANFYAEYYSTGAGKGTPHAKERAENAKKVRFNIETKLMPEGMATDEEHRNHTVGPQAFVDALCGAIVKSNMTARAEVQSFDFRTLILVEEQFPKIPTYYLTGSPKSFSSAMMPDALRVPAR